MLIINKPTESTIQYTVTTQCTASTVPGHALRIATWLARLLSAATAVAILLWQYQGLIFDRPLWYSAFLERIVQSARLSGHEELDQASVVLACIALLWLAFRRGYTEESLLVIQGLGIQTSTSSSSYLLASSTRFIPTTAIQDIFLHEAFIGLKVKFYLSIVVENEDKVVVVFPTILPRLQDLEQIWRGARACLFDTKG